MTDYEEDDYYALVTTLQREHAERIDELEKELSRYKQVEERFRFDLPILGKIILQHHVHVKSEGCERPILNITKDGVIVETQCTLVGHEHEFWKTTLPFSEYGKTWALDKNDLTSE